MKRQAKRLAFRVLHLKNVRKYSSALHNFRGTAEPRANAKRLCLFAVIRDGAWCLLLVITGTGDPATVAKDLKATGEALASLP